MDGKKNLGKITRNFILGDKGWVLDPNWLHAIVRRRDRIHSFKCLQARLVKRPNIRSRHLGTLKF